MNNHATRTDNEWFVTTTPFSVSVLCKHSQNLVAGNPTVRSEIGNNVYKYKCLPKNKANTNEGPKGMG